MAAPSAPVELMAEWDLTSTMAQYLDRHLIFPLMGHLESQTQLFKPEDLLKAKFALLSDTSMVDSTIDIYKEMNPGADESEALAAKRKEVLAKLEDLTEKSKPFQELFSLPEVQEMAASVDGAQLREYLESNHGFNVESLDTLYDYAHLLYDIGMYDDAGQMLYQFSALVPDTSERAFSALWGRFACGILGQKWDDAVKDLERLKEFIDADSGNPTAALRQLQQRTWLIHWSLFVFFRMPNDNPETGLDALIELFLYDAPYANTIQTVCPHILRYLSTAVIVQSQTQKRKGVMKQLIKVIQQESYIYKDPITEFVECLYVNFDFDSAQKKLKECETVLLNDFFLAARRTDFIEHSRLFIFETYCRIHNTISINMLAEKLNMDVARAEEWIVNLIRHARLDAKIDSKAGTVLMTPKVPSIYHQVIERTKSLTFRSSALAEGIERAARPKPQKRFD